MKRTTRRALVVAKFLKRHDYAFGKLALCFDFLIACLWLRILHSAVHRRRKTRLNNRYRQHDRYD